MMLLMIASLKPAPATSRENQKAQQSTIEEKKSIYRKQYCKCISREAEDVFDAGTIVEGYQQQVVVCGMNFYWLGPASFHEVIWQYGRSKNDDRTLPDIIWLIAALI